MLNIANATEHSAQEQRIAQIEPLYLKTVTLELVREICTG
jgi:hypothetical protein